MRQRKLKLNEHAIYFVGTGCIRFPNGAVVELTVSEEEVFDLLLRTPKITVPWEYLEAATCRSNQTLRHVLRTMRDKLGTRAVKTHVGKGISLQPHFIGAARFPLIHKETSK